MNIATHHGRASRFNVTIFQLLIFTIAIFVVAVGRYLWLGYLVNLRGPLGLFAIPLVLCPFAILTIVFISVYVVLIGRVFKHRNRLQLIPMFLYLLLGTFLAFQIPPPIASDPPEKLHFLEFRADYEAVVELARNNDLQHGEQCPALFIPPPLYAHVSSAGCMFVEIDEQRGLRVVFNPIESFYHPVVYVEFDDVNNPCGYDLRVEQKIDDNWYACEREWN